MEQELNLLIQPPKALERLEMTYLKAFLQTLKRCINNKSCVYWAHTLYLFNPQSSEVGHLHFIDEKTGPEAKCLGQGQSALSAKLVPFMAGSNLEVSQGRVTCPGSHSWPWMRTPVSQFKPCYVLWNADATFKGEKKIEFIRHGR